MPWNDASKPSGEPGPWDAPSDTPPDRSREAHKPRPAVSPSAPWDVATPEARRPAPKRSDPDQPARRPVAPPPARGPDLDDLGRQLRARFVRSTSGARSRRIGWAMGAAAVVGLAAGWMASGVFEVPGGSRAVVTRWGAPAQEVGEGLHYHWPAPVGAVTVVSLQALHRLELGAGDPDAAAGRVLTRDGDAFSLAATATWRVRDLHRYLTGLADPAGAIRAAATAALRQAASETPTAALLASDHGDLADRARQRAQATLDRAGAGVALVGLALQAAAPPDAASGALHDLQAAADDTDAAKREAAAYRARVTAEAHADAARMLSAAQAARDSEVSEARGEAERFALMDAEYQKTPEATRDRLYTETMQRVLHDTPKVIVELPKGQTAQINLPPEALRAPPPLAPSASGPAVGGGAP
jgi:modulator of FtsH protease HflK